MGFAVVNIRISQPYLMTLKRLLHLPPTHHQSTTRVANSMPRIGAQGSDSRSTFLSESSWQTNIKLQLFLTLTLLYKVGRSWSSSLLATAHTLFSRTAHQLVPTPVPVTPIHSRI
jgi:hypothetical protein